MTRAALLRGVDLAFHGTRTLGQERAASVDTAPGGELRVLLATDPMTSCGDAERAIAQFAQVGRVRVDVVHVLKPGGLTRENWQRLHETLAGPIRGTVDHHIVEDVDPAAAIARFCGSGDYDLLDGASVLARRLVAAVASFRARRDCATQPRSGLDHRHQAPRLAAPSPGPTRRMLCVTRDGKRYARWLDRRPCDAPRREIAPAACRAAD